MLSGVLLSGRAPLLLHLQFLLSVWVVAQGGVNLYYLSSVITMWGVVVRSSLVASFHVEMERETSIDDVEDGEFRST
jgi:hypothetical protein